MKTILLLILAGGTCSAGVYLALALPLAVALLSAAVLVTLGFAAALNQLVRAPEGYEDNTGFHWLPPQHRKPRSRVIGLHPGLAH